MDWFHSLPRVQRALVRVDYNSIVTRPRFIFRFHARAFCRRSGSDGSRQRHARRIARADLRPLANISATCSIFIQRLITGPNLDWRCGNLQVIHSVFTVCIGDNLLCINDLSRRHAATAEDSWLDKLTRAFRGVSLIAYRGLPYLSRGKLHVAG